MNVEVLGLGDAGIDILLHVPHLPKYDEKILATNVERHVGGVIANFLCALNTLGMPSGFIGCIGDDQFGLIVQDGLKSVNVDVSRLIVKRGEETYFCVSMLDQTGEKALVIGLTSTIFPKPEDISKDFIQNARLLHTTGLYFDTSMKAFSFAQEEGMLVSMDLEPSTLSQGMDKVLKLIEMTDILFVNQHALELIFPGVSPVSGGKTLLDLGPDLVIFTRGAEGSVAISHREIVETPAFRVPVVDTTGAGDCFNAAFIYGYLNDWPIDKIALFANAAAAISTTSFGAQSALPTLDQVERFIQQEQPDFIV